MKVIDVYSQYFSADCVFAGVERRGVLVKLTSTCVDGNICYEVFVTLFPHRDAEEFAVSYDACASKEIYNARGRRSKKREAAFLEEFRLHADELTAGLNGSIFWDKPLTEPRMG